MEFKYMLVGTQFFGDQDMFVNNVSQSSGDAQAPSQWHCDRYDQVMRTKGAQVGQVIQSVSGNSKMTLEYAKD